MSRVVRWGAVAGSMADSDARLVRGNILKMAALATRFREFEMVPAHDERSFEPIADCRGQAALLR